MIKAKLESQGPLVMKDREEYKAHQENPEHQDQLECPEQKVKWEIQVMQE